MSNCTCIRDAVRTGLLSLAALALTAHSGVAAEPRFALVIGNSKYEEAPLKNPANDARLMERTLKDLGFEVTTHLDLDRKAMTRAISLFGSSLPPESVACVFYAGHGLQVDQHNYLVPTGAQFTAKWEVEHEAIDQDRIVDMLENSNSRVRMVIFDCCLNNPFDRGWRSNRSLVDSRMAPPPMPPSGTIILYSTGDGQTAADGLGKNSPFTKAVAAAFSARPANGLLLTTAIASVGNTMVRQFGKDQKPHMRVDTAALTFQLFGADPASNISLVAEQPSAVDVLAPTPMTQPGEVGGLTENLNPKKVFDDSHLAQANEYYNARKFDLAILSYRAVLEDADLDNATRRQARLGRGRTYLQRRSADDMQRALIDYKAAGEPGIPLTFFKDDVDLRIGTTVTGRGRKFQSALVTHSEYKSNETWFYVKSVASDDTLRGWAMADAFRQTGGTTVKPSKPMVQPGTTAGPNVSSPSTISQPRQPQGLVQSGQRNFNGSQQAGGQNWSPIQNKQQSNNRNSGGNRAPSGADNYTRRYIDRNGRPPSIWETPRWESPAEIRQLRARGLVR